MTPVASAIQPVWDSNSLLKAVCSSLVSGQTEEEMRMYEALDFAQLPIYVYRSNTARRLRGLVSKVFKDRDFRFIQKRT